MSLKFFNKEINKFLADPSPSVLAIHGDWGTGKTHIWNKLLEEQLLLEAISLEKYSYVSTFGINSLDDLKFSIYENATDLDIHFAANDPRNIYKNIKALSNKILKKSGPFKNLMPQQNAIKALEAISFSTIRNTFVCIDDIERRGKNLKISDLMGIVSLLKEQMSCKVILILNDDQLEEKDQYELLTEKVVDISLKYKISTDEAFSIVFETEENQHDQDTVTQIKKLCAALNITNIRILRKIGNAILNASPFLAITQPGLKHDILLDLTLFTWAKHSSSSTPSLEFILDYGTAKGRSEKYETGTPEFSWNLLLNKYGYLITQNLDNLLAQGIIEGHFNEIEIVEIINTINKEEVSRTLLNEFHSVWEMFQYSLDDNEGEFVKNLLNSCKKYIERIGANELSDVIEMLMSLNRVSEVDSVIDFYISHHKHNNERFNTKSITKHAHKEYHPYMLEKFNDRYIPEHDQEPIHEMLLRIHNSGGWSREDTDRLSKLSSEDFFGLFHRTKGNDLHNIIKTSLNLASYSDNQEDSPDQHSTLDQILDALRKIEGESNLNKLRLKRYKITSSNVVKKT